MRSKLKRIFTGELFPHLADRVWRPIGGRPTDSVGSIVLSVLMVVFFYLGIRKLGSLRLTETQLFFGVLLLVAVLMLGVCIILLYQVLWGLKRRADGPSTTTA